MGRGSIEKREGPKGVGWRLRVYAGGGHYVRKTLHGITKREAERQLRRLVDDVEQTFGSPVPSAGTVAAMLDRWSEFVAPSLSPTTARDYRSIISAHLKPILGDRAADKVSVFVLDHELYPELKRRGLGPARVYRAHSVLSSAYKQAIRWGMLEVNPTLSASPPPVKATAIRPPDPSEVRTLVERVFARNPDFATYLVVDADTGARRGELVGLRWSDVDLAAGEIRIRRNVVDGGPGVGLVIKETKTDRERVVTLGATALQVLKDHRRRMMERLMACAGPPAPDPYVFSLEADGSKHLRPDYCTHRFDHFRGTDLAHVRLHDLRHFMATQLLANGAPIGVVADRLGHGRDSTTQDVYRHFVPAADKRAAEMIDEILWGKR